MRIVVDIHNSIFRDAVARTLRAFSSEFEVYDSEDPAQTADVCGRRYRTHGGYRKIEVGT